jgi:anti-sigma regulatory factor (Ser/Thr protein kinase)
MRPIVDVRLPAIPASVPAARRIADDLRSEIEPSLLDDLRLLISELVTNSLRHAGVRPSDRIGLRVERCAEKIRVRVSDPGRGFATPRPIETIAATSGWGLRLVERIAERWGHESGPGTSFVWFEAKAPGRDPAHPNAGS